MTTKKKILLFFIVLFLGVLIIPLTNINSVRKTNNFKSIFTQDFLKAIYLQDNLEGQYNKLLSQFQLSGNIGMAIVGNKDMYFLGNKHNYSIQQHNGTFPNEQNILDLQHESFKKIFNIFDKNLIPYLLLAIPDKEAVYPEYLPEWYDFKTDSSVQKLFRQLDESGIKSTYFLNFFKKHKKDNLLFYKGDSHWQNEAAYLAYLKEMDLLDSSLVRLENEEFKYTNVISQNDIVNFLKFPIDDILVTPIHNLMTKYEIESCEISLELLEKTNCLVGVNTGISTNFSSHIVSNKTALNGKTLLWFRDSFGVAQSPYFQASFSEVIQIHPNNIKSLEQIEQVIKKYKPDYIIYSLIERNFMTLPVL